MRKMGGFFIGLILLAIGCGIKEEPSFGVIPEINIRGNDFENSDVKDDADLKEDNFENSYPFVYHGQDFKLEFASFDWRIAENKNRSEGIILTAGNYKMDELLHPLEGEITVEALKFLNEEKLSLWNWAIKYKQEYKGVLIDYYGDDDRVRLLFDYTQMPDGFEGGWIIGYTQEYYFAKDSLVYVFSASVNERDFRFLEEFETMIESLEIGGENEH